MRIALLLASISILLIVVQVVAAQATQPTEQEQLDPLYWFDQARQFEEQKNYEQALAALRKVIELEPTNSRAHSAAGGMFLRMEKWEDGILLLQKALELNPRNLPAMQNLGLACQNIGKPAESNQVYEAFLQLEPDNWRARAKLVQNYQALGDVEACDREREKLLAMRKEGKVDQDSFCREQFRVGDNKVMAMEYFELSGERAKRYVFHVIDSSSGKTLYRVSLGSYELTDQIAHQTGELKPGERGFHLDGYYPDEHRTFAFYNKEPTYEETRKLVVEVIEGKAQPISATKSPGAGR
jgi:tetratricopeptide (TPR) repeat protein